MSPGSGFFLAKSGTCGRSPSTSRAVLYLEVAGQRRVDGSGGAGEGPTRSVRRVSRGQFVELRGNGLDERCDGPRTEIEFQPGGGEKLWQWPRGCQ